MFATFIYLVYQVKRNVFILFASHHDYQLFGRCEAECANLTVEDRLAPSVTYICIILACTCMFPLQYIPQAWFLCDYLTFMLLQALIIWLQILQTVHGNPSHFLYHSLSL